MRAVVLATDPHDGNARLWCRELEAVGVDAQLVWGDPARLPGADVVVAHLLLSEGGAQGAAWSAARRYERAGVPLLNSTAALAVCADKWRTYAVWRSAGLAQPRTWRLGDLEEWPLGRMLVKPAFGESARGIAVVDGWDSARRATAAWPDQALVQEVVACRSVLRVHAGSDRVLGAFARPAAELPGLPHPDPAERPVEVTEELEALATGAVRAVGGRLVGLDLIEHDGGTLLLEANPTFAMPAHLPALMRALTLEAVALLAETAT